GAITADLLAFTAMSQRLLLRQIAGLQQGPEASVLKVAAAWNATRLQQAVLSWQGPDAATMDGTNGAAIQRYLSLPPTLIGGGTREIQLNVIAELVLCLPRLICSQSPRRQEYRRSWWFPGRRWVRGQSCKLTGQPGNSTAGLFPPDVADPRAMREGLPCPISR